ncbi:PhzF family phenazine biosynthesis protein [Neobacillus bataviensis]|uniref:PhzF family phenazine biosynthesis protein n=1 Tax=Neobacillus bataviensis TaxID=220685 RepID=A0A561D7H7_9BACI|nr:PhzF family phenazine biosynthesis isomerase [Neobacillus bataviensis]TWD99386.1 PhzF family phenazine biosynthesis protein [Neobacillus bataviensis]
MKSVKVFQYDAFSKEPNKGNPAGVVFNGDDLTEEEMQEVALKVGFNETAFPVKSDIADLRIRFFTPGHEMNLCGHGTMAMVYALKTNGLLGDKTDFTIETKAGILPVKINDQTNITMKQAAPQFKAFNGCKEELASVIGLTEEEIDADLPVLYGSTGIWTLLVPIRKLASFEKMKPNNKRFPSVLKEMPQASIHPICLETYHSEANLHGRHFSSPNSGTIEDPVTGTASGVMGAYYAKYIKNDFKDFLNLVVEQGQEIGKDGLVTVHVAKSGDSYDIEITGNAVLVREFEVIL